MAIKIKKIDQKTGLSILKISMLLLLIPLLWQMYNAMARHTMYMFSEPLEDMSHGWLIPIVSLYLLWHKRKELALGVKAPSWGGVFCTILSLVIFWFGSRGGQSRIEQISCIGLLWSISYAFWGRDVAKLTLFPIGFLVFTIPVSSFLDIFTIHLRFISSAGACTVLNGFGLEIQRSGTAIFSRSAGAEFNVDVADPCSGIRSLFALMALTAVYAWITQKSFLQKIALFACAIPLAVVGNMFRIISICLVASWFGQEAATGFYHDYSGYVVFVIAILLMFQSGLWISKMDGWVLRQKWLPNFLQRINFNPGNSDFACRKREFLPVICVVLLVSVFAVLAARIPAPSYDEISFIAADLPVTIKEFTGEIPWFCQNEQCLNVATENNLQEFKKDNGYLCPACGGVLSLKSLGENNLLPKDTVILKRQYHSSDGMVYSMNVVVGGKSRNSIHRAELCMPAQGFHMDRAESTELTLKEGAAIEVRRINAHRQNSHDLTLLYWFVSKKRSCSSHTERILLDVWDRSIHNRINRWVMFSVFVPSGLNTPESVERFELFLAEFYSQVLLKEKLDND